VAVLAPFLGANRERAAREERMLAAFMALGASGCAALFFVGRGDWLAATALLVP